MRAPSVPPHASGSPFVGLVILGVLIWAAFQVAPRRRARWRTRFVPARHILSLVAQRVGSDLRYFAASIQARFESRHPFVCTCAGIRDPFCKAHA